MARYGRDYGRGTRGRDTYDLDYNAGYGGLEEQGGGPQGRQWANYYTGDGYGPRHVGERGMRTGGARAHGRHGRDYGMDAGRRFGGGYDRDYDVNFGDRLRRGWNELRRNESGRFW